MRLTIIPADRTVVKDGVGYPGLDLSGAGIPETVHALQWQEASGAVEHTDLTNEAIAVLPQWAELALAVWQAANEAANAPPPEFTAEERRAAWRAQAYLEKAAFVIALLDAQILPAAEAVQASKGDWPQTFADALAALGVDPIRAQVAWGAATGVARQNPLFLAVLGYYSHANSMTPDQTAALGDRIFGWVE